VGGDLNAYAALSDLRTGNGNDAPTQAFLSRGYLDAHAGLDPDDRVTSFDTGLVIDFLFSRGIEATRAGICDADVCGDLSDHAPVWATFRLGS
jgi:endonuclease/exonuclease/phosphatase (EEP) superfamily protein YafD